MEKDHNLMWVHIQQLLLILWWLYSLTITISPKAQQEMSPKSKIYRQKIYLAAYIVVMTALQPGGAPHPHMTAHTAANITLVLQPGETSYLIWLNIQQLTLLEHAHSGGKWYIGRDCTWSENEPFTSSHPLKWPCRLPGQKVTYTNAAHNEERVCTF